MNPAKTYRQMLNAQVSILNECLNGQCLNELNYCFIDNSLKIEHCKLKIASEGAVG